MPSATKKKEIKSHGYVKFPHDNEMYYDDREGGMVVFAVWDFAKKCACCNDLEIYLFGTIANKWYDRFLQEQLDKRVDRNIEDETDLYSNEIVKTYLPVIERSCIGDGKYYITEAPCYLEKRFAVACDITRYMFMQKYPLYLVKGGVLYLGSSNGCWVHKKTKNYWKASYKDLTDEGKNLVKLLNKLNGCKAKLLTVIDT